MRLTILGSGGCAVIPKPLCRCDICEEARKKGGPYERSGPSAFIEDENILIDTPAEICTQLNRARIERIDTILLTHLDPDHVEGLRVAEQIALGQRLGAKEILFVHLEEYWNRSYDDYLAIQGNYENIIFAYDNMQITL